MTAVQMPFPKMMSALIKLADKHREADEYIAGTYWNSDDNQGCAIGCTIADAKKLGIVNGVDYHDHRGLAKATGIPWMLLCLADHVFEGLPATDRPAWTPAFLRAVKASKDLEHAPASIMARLARRLAADAIREDVRAVTNIVADLWDRRASGDDPPQAEWHAAGEQADAAWKQAYAAGEQAYAAGEQADAACEQWWRWCAEMALGVLKGEAA